jgi:hypothetical protein
MTVPKTLGNSRRLFLAAGYSKSEYARTLVSFGKEAPVWLTVDGIVVQQDGYARFIHHPFKTPLVISALETFGNMPSLNAEFLLYLFLDSKNCDAVVGDLQERYSLVCEKYGRRRANFWYWTQAIRSVGPIVLAWVMKAGRRLMMALLTWAAAHGLLKDGTLMNLLVEWVKKIRS